MNADSVIAYLAEVKVPYLESRLFAFRAEWSNGKSYMVQIEVTKDDDVVIRCSFVLDDPVNMSNAKKWVSRLNGKLQQKFGVVLFLDYKSVDGTCLTVSRGMSGEKIGVSDIDIRLGLLLTIIAQCDDALVQEKSVVKCLHSIEDRLDSLFRIKHER